LSGFGPLGRSVGKGRLKNKYQENHPALRQLGEDFSEEPNGQLALQYFLKNFYKSLAKNHPVALANG
jgi:hypothetical protein